MARSRKRVVQLTPLEAVIADLQRAGFELSDADLEELGYALGFGNGLRTNGTLTLVDVLATVREATAAPGEHAFRAASRKTKGAVTVCLVARADHMRWTVGIAPCDAREPTPADCAFWKLARYRAGGNNAAMLERWSHSHGPGRVSLRRALAVTLAPSTKRADTRERALLREIAATPDDDEPRLVYADWLADHDPDRGEFIALSCRAAALPSGAERRRLEKRADELRIAHRDAWEGHLAWVATLTFRRGFVHAVQVGAEELLAHPELFGEPGLAELTLSVDDPDELDRVLALSGIERIEALTLDTTEADELVLHLAATRPNGLAKLRRLCVSFLGDAGAFALADPAVLPGLTTLELEASPLGAAAAKALRKRRLAVRKRW